MYHTCQTPVIVVYQQLHCQRIVKSAIFKFKWVGWRLGEECSYTFQQTKHPSAHTPTVATKTWHGQHARSSPAQAFLASQLNLTSLWWITADHLIKEALICANANVMLLYLVIIRKHSIKIIVQDFASFPFCHKHYYHMRRYIPLTYQCCCFEMQEGWYAVRAALWFKRRWTVLLPLSI